MERGRQQHLAVLQQPGSDLATRPRQVIERVVVNTGGNDHDDTGIASQWFPSTREVEER